MIVANVNQTVSNINAISQKIKSDINLEELVQNDIKKIVAYSTCSQLGYMFFAAGIGAYHVAMFHLFTHAFFKALLFLEIDFKEFVVAEVAMHPKKNNTAPIIAMPFTN